MKPLLVVAAAVAVVAVFLLLGARTEPSPAQPTSTALPSSGVGWTEEDMRDARAKDMTVGPSAGVLVAVLIGLAGVAFVVLRRSSSR